MPLMLSKTCEALVAAPGLRRGGLAPEEKAREAAEEIAGYDENRLGKHGLAARPPARPRARALLSGK